MGLFGIFGEMKENNDRRSEAREYNKRAQEYVRDGREIYEKAQDDVSSYSFKTKLKVEEHYNYKRRVVGELSKDVYPVLSSFKNFDIDSKIFDTPSISNTSNNSLGALIGGASSFDSISGSLIAILPIPNILNLFGNADEEYYEARRQRDEAKSYYESMKHEREKLRNIKENMRVIRIFMEDEKQLIDSMESKLKTISSQLKENMSKDSVSVKEADYLKVLHAIAESINGLISNKFLDDNLSVSKQYKSSFDKLKAIDTSLGSEPSLKQGKNSITKLLEIIDVTSRKYV